MAPVLLHGEPAGQVNLPETDVFTVAAFAVQRPDPDFDFQNLAYHLEQASRPDLILLSGVVADQPKPAARATFGEFAGDMRFSWTAVREQVQPQTALATYHVIFSRLPLEDIHCFHLPSEAAAGLSANPSGWVGDRCALRTTIRKYGHDLGVTVLRLEPHTCPAGRARQLDAVFRHASNGNGLPSTPQPRLVFGGFNSQILDGEGTDSAHEQLEAERIERNDPHAFVNPVSREPLFAVAASHGFTWDPFNEPFQATTRHPFTQQPAKLDWFLGCDLAHHVRRIEANSLKCSNPALREDKFAKNLVLELNTPFVGVEHLRN